MTRDRVRGVGDRAVLIECEHNRDALGYAALLRDDPTLGAEDIVPAAETVLVIFGDPAPASTLLATVRTRIGDGPRPEQAHADAPIPLPVRYDGPDLGLVAELTGLTPDEVVARHAARIYTVAFIGFIPGFAYLSGLDPALAVSRRADPRTEVPAGSVAIAGDMAAVYPRNSPGGWRLLGTTTARLFDVTRDSPSLLSSGDRVRFVPR